MPRPLEGIRVLDFTRLLPGAYCTWLLGSLGAQVIKIEQTGAGDYQRSIGRQIGTKSAMFELVNRGKRSLAIDLKRAAGTTVLERLLQTGDVIIENFRPGVAQRLGIDFDKLLAQRPALVCASISGYGSSGPMRDHPGHDINYLAFGGLLNRLLRKGGGLPEIALVDLIGGGLVPALGIVSLILQARLTGHGGQIDAALADSIPLLPNEIMLDVLAGDPEPTVAENDLSGELPYYSVYRLADGHVAVGAVEAPFWKTLCERMGLQELSDRQNDKASHHEIRQALTRRFAAMTRANIDEVFGDGEACVNVVNDYKAMFADKQVRARDFTRPSSSEQGLPLLGSPFVFNGARQYVSTNAPELGEHSLEILTEIGVPQATIDQLLASGAIGVAKEQGLEA